MSEIKDPIKLNVGGTIFMTSSGTLMNQKDSFFTGLLSGKFKINVEKDESIFIDRDPTYFQYILNFLRDSTWRPEDDDASQANAKKLLKEAEFYQITSLIDILENYISQFKLVIVCMRSYSHEYDFITHMIAANFKITHQTVSSDGKGRYIYTFESSKPSYLWNEIKNDYYFKEKILRVDYEFYQITNDTSDSKKMKK